MLPDIQPGNTKILYFFNCLLDGMHTKIKHICDFSRCRLNARFKRSHPTFAPRPQICFIYLPEGCVLAGEENSIYCWRDLGNHQMVMAFHEIVVPSPTKVQPPPLLSQRRGLSVLPLSTGSWFFKAYLYLLYTTTGNSR